MSDGNERDRSGTWTEMNPDTYPQRLMLANSRICRDGMGPMNPINSVRKQSRPARQSPCNDFWGNVRMNSIEANIIG